ncbi:MAG: metal-sensing transcriptional repressor [Coriobacteriales bacterium]|jgi:DNA-binding FrmR family transcriptional regulator
MGTHETEAKQSCQCARYKNTPREAELQKDLQKRLNRAIGQLNGVKQMIDDNRYCGDVLVQLSAAVSALKSVERIVLQNHLETCVVEQIREGNDEIVDEAMDLIMRVAK